MYKRLTTALITLVLALCFFVAVRTLFTNKADFEHIPSHSIAPPTNTASEPRTLTPKQLIVPVDEWKKGVFANPLTLLLPDDFDINVFATGFQKPRMMAFSPDGILYVTDPDAGTVYALPDKDKNGIADDKVPVATELGYPTGIAWHGSDLFVADTTKVFRLANYDTSLAFEDKEVVIDSLPDHGLHITRTLAFGPENKLYVSVGSSCDHCEDDERRGGILQFSLSGKDESIFARGLRNAVGLALHPDSNELYVTDNGRDYLGDDLPPDEIDVVSAGKNYGWPKCYGNKVPDPVYNDQHYCDTTEPPAVMLPAHVAPLGLAFAPESFGSSYKNNLFVGQHGSWNRSIPVGYKVIRIWWDASKQPHTEDFVTGWLQGTTVLGRPVDVAFDQKGSLFVTDDKNGVIYRVSRK